MELKLKRIQKSKKSTIGELYIDNVKFCNTLEDVDRGLKQVDTLAHIKEIKVQNNTAIPTGRYQVIMNLSNRFKIVMPLLIDVPGFEGIRMHVGNSDVDTDGCILLGTWDGKTPDFISNSRITVNNFYPKLAEGLKKGNVFINIV